MLREWQQQAKENFLSCGKPDFLLSATPGAGKTRFALDLARDLVAAGQVERVVVVVPSDTLRQQWADQGDAFGIPLMPVSDPSDYERGRLPRMRGYLPAATRRRPAHPACHPAPDAGDPR